MSLDIVRRVLGVPRRANEPASIRVTGHGRTTLTRLFKAIGATRGAEIGVWRGGFSAQICDAVPGVALLCVDPWTVYDAYRDQKSEQAYLDDAKALAHAALTPYGCDIRQATSVDAAATVPDGSLDFVYIDGNHHYDYVQEDLRVWMPKVRSGGIVSGHDYVINPRKPQIQVKAAVDAFTRERGIAPWFILAGDKTPSFMWVVA